MTLSEAKAYMISNPGIKFTCQVFHDEWIMYDEKRSSFVFEDGYAPDKFWWRSAMSWEQDWWIVKETEKEFDFISKPATSRGQSEKLIALGLKKESADMHWRMHRTFDGKEIWNCYAYEPVRWGVNNMLPAWSLYRLWEILPKVVFLRPALHLTMCGDSVFYCTEDNNEDFEKPFSEYLNLYDNIIDCVEWLIQEGCFPKEYLEER